jgi:hypothetical protein
LGDGIGLQPREARLAWMELAIMIGFYLALAVLDWRFVAGMMPFAR